MDYPILFPIKDYEGRYSITKDGKIWSHINKGGWLKGHLAKGYRYYCLTKIDKTHSHKSAHRLVAQTFLPNTYNRPEVNHKNGIKDDNCFQNLEWVTAKQNSQHTYDVLGYISKRRKLSDSDVVYIRLNYIKGQGNGYRGNKHILCELFNVAGSVILNIVNRKTYKKPVNKLLYGKGR